MQLRSDLVSLTCPHFSKHSSTRHYGALVHIEIDVYDNVKHGKVQSGKQRPSLKHMILRFPLVLSCRNHPRRTLFKKSTWLTWERRRDKSMQSSVGADPFFLNTACHTTWAVHGKSKMSLKWRGFQIIAVRIPRPHAFCMIIMPPGIQRLGSTWTSWTQKKKVGELPNSDIHADFLDAWLFDFVNEPHFLTWLLSFQDYGNN
jgi:hypothetical protein